MTTIITLSVLILAVISLITSFIALLFAKIEHNKLIINSDKIKNSIGSVCPILLANNKLLVNRIKKYKESSIDLCVCSFLFLALFILTFFDSDMSILYYVSYLIIFLWYLFKLFRLIYKGLAI